MTATPSTVPTFAQRHQKPIIIVGCFGFLIVAVVVGVAAQKSAADRDRNFKNALTDYQTEGQERLSNIRRELEKQP